MLIVPVTVPIFAEIVAVPAFTPVTRPNALTVATEGSELAQVVCAVRVAVV
jgi:hypothetical protein